MDMGLVTLPISWQTQKSQWKTENYKRREKDTSSWKDEAARGNPYCPQKMAVLVEMCQIWLCKTLFFSPLLPRVELLYVLLSRYPVLPQQSAPGVSSAVGDSEVAMNN